MIQPFAYTLLLIGAFLLAAAFSYALTPSAIGIANRWGLLDQPQGRKKHRRPTPFLGGAALFISYWLCVGAGIGLVGVLDEQTLSQATPIVAAILEALPKLAPQIFWIFTGSVVIFLLGLLDDIFDLHPLIKLIGQIGASACLLKAGLFIQSFSQWWPLGVLVTFLWPILMMNAFNFIDSIDGHCCGVALASCLVFFAVAQILGQPVVGVAIVTFTGILFGFYPYNFKPARIFLGDNGSLFIGYMLAAITLLCTYQRGVDPTFVTVFIPIFVFGVPIYDTLSVVAVRIWRRVPPWKGDRNHFAHRLIRLGMSEKVAVIFSYFLALTLGLIALISTQLSTVLGTVLIFLLFLSIIGIVALLEFYSALRISLMESLASKHKRRREDVQESEEEKL